MNDDRDCCFSEGDSRNGLEHEPSVPLLTMKAHAEENGLAEAQGSSDYDQDDEEDNSLVQYQIQEFAPNTFRAFFAVPFFLLDRLMEHPVVCRGGMFYLCHDEGAAESSITEERLQMTIVTIDFLSPYPEEVALALAERLTRRVERTREEHEEDQKQQKFSTSGRYQRTTPAASFASIFL